MILLSGVVALPGKSANRASIDLIYRASSVAAVAGEQELNQLSYLFWFCTASKDCIVWKLEAQLLIERMYERGVYEATARALRLALVYRRIEKKARPQNKKWTEKQSRGRHGGQHGWGISCRLHLPGSGSPKKQPTS
jgi:hypothetical protein